MKTLILKEKRGPLGLHQINQKQWNLKALTRQPISNKALQERPLINSNQATSLRSVTQKIVYRRLLKLKTELEAYTKGNAFEKAFSFGYFLNQYIRRQNKFDKQFARDIGVTHAAISQYLNNHRKPTKEFLVRLELHSNNLFPAIIWFKLLQKEKEYEIITNTGIRIAEKKHVKATIYLPEVPFK